MCSKIQVIHTHIHTPSHTPVAATRLEIRGAEQRVKSLMINNFIIFFGHTKKEKKNLVHISIKFFSKFFSYCSEIKFIQVFVVKVNILINTIFRLLLSFTQNQVTMAYV